ncbi:bestrophin family protein [uncultured Hymenobacter sp.]|uniref:bestrophin family protein n=1 Tax=uncultured Hymenobacter sp. TaxID=170016 RepID=UPI0035CB6F10
MLLETKLPIQYIFTRILPDILRVLMISIVFQLLKKYFAADLPPIPLQLPTILGSSISLLLAFKIGQSYDRWWEARKLWGAIVNDSRTLVLQIKSFVRKDFLSLPAEDSPLKAIAYRQIAWCYVLGESLRGLDPTATLEKYLPEPELLYLRPQNNKALALLALHAEQIKTLHEQEALNTFQQVQLDSTLVRLCDSMGGAERIKNTVFPVTYRLLLHFFIYLFLLTLSLGLVETIGLWEIPVLLAIASTFFLLERTARYLQDPFNNYPTDTPVTAIARTVDINLKQLLQEAQVPAPLVAQQFYVM